QKNLWPKGFSFTPPSLILSHCASVNPVPLHQPILGAEKASPFLHPERCSGLSWSALSGLGI
ncbi:MAG: hypothetical protein JJU46_04870, partial [Balneolaceae bacterium]|nr:hypothetical protein [Balneolaceae bacterium]